MPQINITQDFRYSVMPEYLVFRFSISGLFAKFLRQSPTVYKLKVFKRTKDDCLNIKKACF